MDDTRYEDGQEGTEPAPARRGRKAEPPEATSPRGSFSPQQRLLILDAWLRSELSAGDFSTIVGVSYHTLRMWKRVFEREGPAGLEDHPRRKPIGSSRLSEPTQRAILLMKQSHPDWGIDRIHHMLLRSDGYAASPGAIQRVLVDAGYEMEAAATQPHAEPEPHSFERARPNQLWQSDLFTFTLKRDGRRLYLVAFLDDHSRYVVSFAVGASSAGALVREALEAGIADYGPPEEVLTDNGPQYHTWRGKSAFTKLLVRRGIHHIVARPRHPQTLGKVERFWGTLWRECLEQAVLGSVEEARERIGHFVGYYNFQRTHQGLGGLVPADRYFEASSEVRAAIAARVDANALDLARHGTPRQRFYLTGRVGEESIALHGEGGKVVLTQPDGRRSEIDLNATGRRVTDPMPPVPSTHDTPDDGGAS